MLNKNNLRELCYVVQVNEIRPIAGKDRVECAVVNGWTVMVRKGQFKVGSLGIYFEVDSRTPQTPEFAFLERVKYKIKIQKYKTPAGPFYSQGLLMGAEDFGWEEKDGFIINGNKKYGVGDFLTETLGVTYADDEDNKRKGGGSAAQDKYQRMANRLGKKAARPWFRWLMKRWWGKRVLYLIYGGAVKADLDKSFPTGRFPGVSVTDQERVECIPDVLKDKTPWIKTEKCDGSSGTYILERTKKGFEFYVCSRRVRMLDEKQENYHSKDSNCWWEVAKKYDIENKMKNWLNENPDANWICWQGEVCGPDIQGNPQHLTELHFFCFHWTDEKNGRRDMIAASADWKKLGMEVVPIVDANYILPDDFEEFKASADGFYSPEVCEGKTDCPIEGYVYYKTTDPTCSFKNVSREYLAKKG